MSKAASENGSIAQGPTGPTTPPPPEQPSKLIEVKEEGGKYSAKVVTCPGETSEVLSGAKFDEDKGNGVEENPTGAKQDTNAELEDLLRKLERLDGDLFKKLKDFNKQEKDRKLTADERDRKKLNLLNEALRKVGDPPVVYFPKTIKESTKLLIGRLEAEDANDDDEAASELFGGKRSRTKRRTKRRSRALRSRVGGKRSRALRSRARRSRALRSKVGGKRSRSRRTKSKRSKSRRR